MSADAVLFDLDDTLYDYHEYARAGLRSAADLLAARTGERLHDELERLYFEEGVTDGTFDALVERHDLPTSHVDDLVDAFHDAGEPLSPDPAAEPVLSRLSETHRLGLVTDGRGGHAKLDRLGIGDHFDAVLVTPTVGCSKREPAAFERILSELSVPPTAAVAVGDDPRADVRTPNRLGMTTVRVRRGRYADLEPAGSDAVPDHEIEALDELPALL
jgi:putative hydrolase of the HAD superfamily